MDLACACDWILIRFLLSVQEKAVLWTWCALAMGCSPCLSRKIVSWPRVPQTADITTICSQVGLQAKNAHWASPLGTMCSHVSSRQQTSPQFVVKSVCKPRMGASCGSLLGLPWTSWGSPGASWVPPVANIGNNLFPRVHPPQQTSLQIAVTSGLQRMPMVSPATCPRKRKSAIFSWTSGLPLVVVTSQRTQIVSSP